MASKPKIGKIKVFDSIKSKIYHTSYEIMLGRFPKQLVILISHVVIIKFFELLLYSL